MTDVNDQREMALANIQLQIGKMAENAKTESSQVYKEANLVKLKKSQVVFLLNIYSNSSVTFAKLEPHLNNN